MNEQRFFICHEHNKIHPANSWCPECEKEHRPRQEAALEVKWRDVIPPEERELFLKCERVYCRVEENAFYEDDGINTNQKERLRTTVLEARKKFLDLYLTTIIKKENNNVYKSKSSNRRRMDHPS